MTYHNSSDTGRFLPGLNAKAPWMNTLEPREIGDYWAAYRSEFPCMAARSREFYDSRTLTELDGLITAAWNTNDAQAYQLAKSYRDMEIYRSALTSNNA